jgi:hypothetical protein
MKNLSLVILLILLISCGQKSQHDHQHGVTSTGDNPNQALKEQAWDIHDEVMPLTENLYNINKGLKEKLESATDEEKAALEVRIRYIDSVNNMMMDWMRKFKDPADTTNQETVRAYYETELEKVKRVKEAILTALEKEKQ